ncbi:hypothetical protein ALPO108162_17120 [Alicyclobacillus pomorum]|jgi:hypothetical protein
MTTDAGIVHCKYASTHIMSVYSVGLSPTTLQGRQAFMDELLDDETLRKRAHPSLAKRLQPLSLCLLHYLS